MKILTISKILLSSLFVLASAQSFAINAQITKSKTPPVITVTTGGAQASSRFPLVSSDFPAGTSSLKKTILGIDWTATSYSTALGETVELCYYRAYTATPIACHPIVKNSSGTDTGFNSEAFGLGVQIDIRHKITGGPQPSSPAGPDSITIRYSY